MPKFTKGFLERLEPELKERLVWDKALIGFGVRVSPKGRKSFFVQYRHGSRSNRMTLGTFGNLTVEEARKKAKRILGCPSSYNLSQILARAKRDFAHRVS